MMSAAKWNPHADDNELAEFFLQFSGVFQNRLIGELRCIVFDVLWKHMIIILLPPKNGCTG